MINILWYISYVKAYIGNFLLNNGPNYRELEGMLAYPCNLEILTGYVERSNVLNLWDIGACNSKFQLKKYLINKNSYELELILRYVCTVRNLKLGLWVFHEIIRVYASGKLMFRPHGFKRFLGAKLVSCSILKNDRGAQLWFKLLILLCIEKYDFKYRNYLRNKEIAVIGGGSDNDYSNKIDCNDLVIRLNKTSISDRFTSKSGTKTDVTYFRGELGRDFMRKFTRKDLSKIEAQFLVFKERAVYRSVRIPNSRLCVSMDNVYPYSLLNGVPATCIDLVANGARNISIFNVNFNLDPNHDATYRPNNLAPVDFSLIFGWHPPFIQFVIIKFIYTAGMLKGVGKAEAILNLEYRGFVKMFNKQWSV